MGGGGRGGGTPIRTVKLSACAAETNPATTKRTKRTKRERMILDICTSIEEEDVSSSAEDYTLWPLA